MVRSIGSSLCCVCLVAFLGLSHGQQLSGGGYLAVAGQGASTYPKYNFPQGVPLPQLPVLSGNVSLSFTATTISGPGDNSTEPYVLYTGRTYNNTAVPGVIRVKQGEQFRLRVCNNLTAQPYTLDPDQSASYNVRQGPSISAGNNYKTDPNIYGNHLHGIYGPTGTENVSCAYNTTGVPCYVGDNVFADILPGGNCVDWQYDIPSVHAPGTLWLHPHHHGSGSIQTQLASVPTMIDYNPGKGFDFYNTPSCQAMRPYVYADNEIILHMQTFLMSVGLDGMGIGLDHTGPTDDGYIEISTTMVPQDPYCCGGPDEDTDDDVPGQTTWGKVGPQDNSTAGNETGPSISVQEFYTSGASGQFSIINGVYQPVISMVANHAYRFRIIQAATMKWMDISIAEPGCTMALYGRDGVPLPSSPRLTSHIGMMSANRAELFISCVPGNYTLRTGAGPLYEDPGCQSTHCELLRQDKLATLQVSASGNTSAPATGNLFSQACQPTYPPYLQTLLTQNASARDTITARQGLFNFTAPDPLNTPESAACSIDGALFTQTNSIQEEIGVVHELDLENINVHTYHHHVQPYQITSLGKYTVDNGTWLVGDWADTLSRFDNVSTSVVRWRPGPVEIVGRGYSVVHCHLLPHNDEGCMMRFQLLDSVPANVIQPPGRSQAYKAGVTIAGIAAVVIVSGLTIFLVKRRKARKAREAALAAPLVVGGIDPESGSDRASNSETSQDSKDKMRKQHTV